MALQFAGICVNEYCFMKLLLFLSLQTVGVTGGWGGEAMKTENCERSGKGSKIAQCPSRPVNAVLDYA